MCMIEGPWEVEIGLAVKDFVHIAWNAKLLYHILCRGNINSEIYLIVTPILSSSQNLLCDNVQHRKVRFVQKQCFSVGVLHNPKIHKLIIRVPHENSITIQKTSKLKIIIQASLKVILISVYHVLWNSILLSEVHFLYSWKVIFNFWIHVFK